MQRKFEFSVGEYYHIYTRGVDKRIVFNNDRDYSRFQVLLYAANTKKQIHISTLPKGYNLYDLERGETLVDIGCYSEMPNHPHLLLKEKIEGGISKFMGKLLTAYSMYFNTKNERSGTFFVRPFRAQHIANDNHLKYLFAYIHLNPVSLIFPKWKEEGRMIDKKTAKDFLNKYSYSSYLEYLGKIRQEGKILNRKAFPEYFQGVKDFENCLDDWLTFSSSPRTPLDNSLENFRIDDIDEYFRGESSENENVLLE